MKHAIKKRLALGAISIAVGGEQPPTEFQIFASGWNDTDKGRFLFDAKAAASCMAAYREHGIDRMIDLEHLSTDDTSPHYDPDARGWMKLEVRADGSLWGAGVTWTPDGRERLSNRTQRYISPWFGFDPATKRILKVLNVAIVAFPATHNTAALVAAKGGYQMADASAAPSEGGASSGGTSMDQMTAVADALGLGPDASVEDIVAAINAMVSSLKAAMADEAEEPDAPMDPSATAAASPPPPPANGPPPPAGAPDKKKEAVAAASMLLSMTGKATHSEALDEVQRLRSIAIDVESQKAKLAKDRAALEAGERNQLVALLVKLGAETPHTSGLATKKLCKRLADEPIVDLRDRVAQLSASKAASAPAPRAPSGSNADGAPVVELTALELEICKSEGCDPAAFAQLKSQRDSVKTTGGN